jgi:hypothetical protein
MKSIFHEAIQADLQWNELSGPVFQTIFQSKTLRLRMNDFPDEVLWTLIIDGEELDIEETPAGWLIPFDQV